MVDEAATSDAGDERRPPLGNNTQALNCHTEPAAARSSQRERRVPNRLNPDGDFVTF